MDRQQPTAEADRGRLLLQPRSLERPADAGWTLVGGIDDPDPVRIDRGGLLGRSGAGWTLDWWIGADDRWYLPAREPSVRQRRRGPGPIIETSMRVPSGDVVATASPVVVGGRRATVVEVENASPVPVVLAVALRPVTLDGGPTTAHRLELVDGPAGAGPTITVDGRPAVLLPRGPNERVAAADLDVLERVEAGRELAWDGPVEGPLATAACLYPLPHRTSLRFVVPADAGPGRDGPIRFDGLPPTDTVAKGWGSIIDRAGRFGFPDPGLTELVGAARARLMLAAPDLPDRVEAIDYEGALMLEALATGGHAEECRPCLERLAQAFPGRLPADTRSASGPAAGLAVVRAAAAAAELHGPAQAEDLLESVAQLTSLVERRGGPSIAASARLALARVVDRAGQPEAAHHLRSTAGTDRDPHGPGPGPGLDLDGVTALAQLASAAGSWPPDDDPVAAARFLLGARNLLVEADQTGADGPIVRLLPSMPSAWLGGEVEVHRIPVAGHRVSFAIRWHGYRPALLWELDDGGGHTGLDAGPDRPTPVLRCPGLDPRWSSRERAGETLLSGSSVELPATPAPGDSFQ